MNLENFVGREAQARAIISNADARHSSLVVAEAGMGKTALLDFVAPVLESSGKLIITERIGPGFGNWLAAVFEGLWNYGLLPEQTKSLSDDLKAWKKAHRSNDAKAKHLLGICQSSGDIIITIDDASGITPTNRPWMVKFVEACTVVAAVDPTALKKGNTKRFWKLFDEVRLESLSKSESAELLELLMTRYSITTDEDEIYKRSVLDLAQGSPFELNRLVKYHSSADLVKSREITSGSHVFVERDVKQVALAPIVFILGAFTIAGRYIARVQGDMDVYVLSAIGLAFMIIFAPALRNALKPRSQ